MDIVPTMVDNSWPACEGPILEAMYWASESGTDLGQAAHDAVPDLPERVLQETLLTLFQDDYLEAHLMKTAGDVPTVIPTRLMAKGRRAVGQWPSEDLEVELARVIERLEEEETDPERKSRFRRLREALSDAGKDVVARIIAELLKSLGGHVA